MKGSTSPEAEGVGVYDPAHQKPVEIKAPPQASCPPCLAHSGSLLPGPAESALPLGGEEARGGPRAGRLLAPIYSLPTPCPLQLSLPSRQPSLLWLRVLGSPNLPTFQTWLRNHQRLQAAISTNVNPRIHCGHQRNDGGVPRLPLSEQTSCARVWKGPVSLACYSSPRDRAGPGPAPQALYTLPAPHRNIIS